MIKMNKVMDIKIMEIKEDKDLKVILMKITEKIIIIIKNIIIIMIISKI